MSEFGREKTLVYARMQARTHARAHTHTHTHVHTRARAHTLTHAYIHTHTHTQHALEGSVFRMMTLDAVGKKTTKTNRGVGRDRGHLAFHLA